jgi:hypothetical protein
MLMVALSVRPGAVRDWRTGRREVPPNLLQWLRMYAEAIDRLPPLPYSIVSIIACSTLRAFSAP